MPLLLLSFALLSCGQAQEAEAAIEAKAYFFSLEKFFQAEAERLEKIGQSLDKTIQINDQEENHLVEQVDYKREFSMFRKADINRPAWRDKYQVDSLYTDEQLRKIHYLSLDPELKTQEIEVNLDQDGKVAQIMVRSKTETALAGNQSRMTYDPAQGYQINTTQKNRTAETLSIQIDGKFTN